MKHTPSYKGLLETLTWTMAAALLFAFAGCENTRLKEKYAFAEGVPHAEVPAKPIGEPKIEFPERLHASSFPERGNVEVLFLVDINGTVVAAAGKGAGPRLREAAERGVKSWMFEPATTDGKPVRCLMSVTVVFDDIPKLGTSAGPLMRQVPLPN